MGDPPITFGSDSDLAVQSAMLQELTPIRSEVFWVKMSYIVQLRAGSLDGPIWVGLSGDRETLQYAAGKQGPAYSSVGPFEEWVREMSSKARRDLRQHMGNGLFVHPSEEVILGYREPSPPPKQMAGRLMRPYEQLIPFVRRLNDAGLPVMVG